MTTHWQVRAESGRGALFTCGVTAADQPAAEKAARSWIPFDGPFFFTVTPVPERPEEPALWRRLVISAAGL